MNDRPYNFTKNFIRKNIGNKEENKILCQDHTYIDPVEDVTDEFPLSELDYLFDNEELEIHYTLNNDEKYVKICLNTGIDFIYWFEIHCARDFDLKRMIEIFVSRTGKDVQVDFVENQNRSILKYS